MPSIHFQPAEKTVEVRFGASIADAAQAAGIEIHVPCGGQGRCGRCAVRVDEGAVRRRSTLRLPVRDVEAGYALACQTVVEGDTAVYVPPQEEITRHLTMDKAAAKLAVPFAYDLERDSTVRNYCIAVSPPALGDNTSDFSRLRRELRRQYGLQNVWAPLSVLRKLSRTLRAGDWTVTVVSAQEANSTRLLDVLPGDATAALYAAAVDIGTTTVTVYLVDLLSGQVIETAADYNAQIKRGEDVISRIVYATKSNGANGLDELQELVVGTINRLLETCARRHKLEVSQIYQLGIVGNSTMIHILLGLPPENIRLEPYTTTVNFPPRLTAQELGLAAGPEAVVDCLPGVASFVGADITAGVQASGMCNTTKLTLFLDIGTNGEMVLGNRDWLISCACSAGPAFEGAGVQFGMRATTGAIEEVWIDPETFEPVRRVIGNTKPQGLCGSGLISLLAEMFLTGVTDRAGHIVKDGHARIREGEHGGEYVVAWAAESAPGQDIVITQVDIDNLLRAKASIYAGYCMLAQSVGISLDDVEQVLIAGSFGQHINVEKAIEIGLLPDLPWDRFQFLGNTAALGAYQALLKPEARNRVREIARKLTYLELSADNAFIDQFLAALFLPHTDLTHFPTVVQTLQGAASQDMHVSCASS